MNWANTGKFGDPEWRKTDLHLRIDKLDKDLKTYENERSNALHDASKHPEDGAKQSRLRHAEEAVRNVQERLATLESRIPYQCRAS